MNARLAFTLVIGLSLSCARQREVLRQPQDPGVQRRFLEQLGAAHDFRCTTGKGIYLNWNGIGGPSFEKTTETPSWALFAVSDISISNGTATITYESGKSDVRVSASDAGLHFLTSPPYDHLGLELLSIYAYPASKDDSKAFAAVWSSHDKIVDGMPAAQLYQGSCRIIP